MKGVFKCAREDDERRFRSVKRSSLGMPPCTPTNIQGDSSVKAWGCPRASPSPSTIISSSLVSLYFYHFMHYVLCLELLALRFYFLFYLALLAVHNKLEPSFLCVGEKHTPLPKSRTQHRTFPCLSLMCVFFSFSWLLSCFALSFHA